MKFIGSNGFLMIPTEISRDPELLKKPKSIILMGEIISMLIKKNNFYMSDEKLAKHLNCSTRWVNAMLNLLEVNKWIKREKVKENGKIKGRYIVAGEALENIIVTNETEPQFKNHSSKQNHSSGGMEVQFGRR